MHKEMGLILGLLILTATGVTFSSVDIRGKELFFAFAGGITTGVFSQLVPINRPQSKTQEPRNPQDPPI